jgi:hypothetical protein
MGIVKKKLAILEVEGKRGANLELILRKFAFNNT